MHEVSTDYNARSASNNNDDTLALKSLQDQIYKLSAILVSQNDSSRARSYGRSHGGNRSKWF